MTQHDTQVETVRQMTNKEMAIAIFELQQKVKALEEAKATSKTDGVDMTDDHARSVLNGDCKDMKHKDAAQKLGLTYGQVYSCRGGYTFKNIHKELTATGWKNPFAK